MGHIRIGSILYINPFRNYTLIIAALDGIRLCGPIDDDIFILVILNNITLIISLIVIRFRRLHTEVQISVLKIKELTKTVSRTDHELIEALIILHDIRDTQLISFCPVLGRTILCLALLIFQQLHVISNQCAETGIGRILQIKFLRFLSQNIRIELFSRISATVLVEGHQFIGTEDTQFYRHQRGRGSLINRPNLIHKIVRRNQVGIDLQINLLVQERIHQFLVIRHFCTVIGTRTTLYRHINLHRNLTGSIHMLRVTQFS